MKRASIVILAIVSGIFFTIGSASAAFLNTWTDEAAFVAANPGLSMESFESLADGTVLPLTVHGITVSTDNTSYGDFNAINTLMASDGSKSVRYGADSGQSIFFHFSSPVDTIGIYIMDFGTAGGEPVLSYHDNAGNYGNDVLTGQHDGYSRFFRGAKFSSPLTEFWFTMTGANGDGIYFDSLYYGCSSTVPEPASMLLLGLGLVGIAGFRKKMK